MNFKRFFDSTLFFMILSFGLALIIFINAYHANMQNISEELGSKYETTLTDIPIQVNYDQDKYYVYDFIPTVKVRLTSTNRVRLNSEEQETTRSFRVVADLTQTSIGTHEVPLKVEGLNESVRASIEPKVMSVTVEKKVVENIAVNAVVNDNQIKAGFEKGAVSISPSKIKVTTGDKILKRLKFLEVHLPNSLVLSGNYDGDLSVLAFDGEYKPLSIKAVPEKVNLTVRVFIPSKDIDLIYDKKGNLPPGIKDVKITLSVNHAKIYGLSSDLNKINSYTVPIDISKYTTKTNFEYVLSDERFKFEPNKVNVTVEPIPEDANFSSSIENHSSSSTTSSTRSSS